ncbi:hypothetical protein MOQ_004535 [Trypanosoma cruzi marinkellei]|uniref:Uncharacterized protein n=1 Tax=Trypanosoma cruzi marinkellei TaxID=85056 RepID=K2N9U9_TRYCR|nr:hypothetical protein MOQ_006528 [Trypanosoma cruzi marinkellei]EKF31621.1 hypothetical protein MOQ_004535 [Trypanosoma cruzi marinkellei]
MGVAGKSDFMPLGGKRGRKSGTAPFPQSIRGMLVFVTKTLAESLNLAPGACCNTSINRVRGRRRKTKDPSLCPFEERLFKAFQRGFSSCPRKPHALLHTFSLGPSAAKSFAHLQRQTGPSVLECGYYVVDLDHIYVEARTFFDEAHRCWKYSTRGLRMQKKASISRHPELLMIVLSPPETAAVREPGTMFPSLVRQCADNADGREEGIYARLCGFPPSATFSVLSEQLQQLSSGYPNKAMITEGDGWNWLMAHPQSRDISCDWCRATLISSDFVTQSLFFSEWCVPEDFAWLPCPTTTEGWGSDVLGKLLRGISEHLFFAGGADSEPLSKRCRTEDEEAFLDVVIPTGLDAVAASMEALEEAKREVDKRFVGKIHSAVSKPRQGLVLKTLLGQLEMMEEFFSGYAPYPCEESLVNAAEVNFSPPLPAGTPRGRVAQLLKEWERIKKSHNCSSFSSSDTPYPRARHSAAEVEMPAEDAVTPFLEMMRRHFINHGSQGGVPFRLTGDGETLLEAPCVAETTLREPPEEMLELADVAELLTALSASTDIISRVAVGDCGLDYQLPRGPLKSIMEASVTSYISLAFGPKTLAVGTAACGHDAVDLSREGDGDCYPTPGTAPLEVLGDAFLKFMNDIDVEQNERSSQLHDALNEVMKQMCHIKSDEPEAAEGCIILSPKCNGENNMDSDAAFPTTSTASRIMDAARTAMRQAASGLTEVEAKSRGIRWLIHIAFLFSYVSVPVGTSSPIYLPAPTLSNETEVDQVRRLVRGLEAHLFFLDAALCAVDEAIVRRWEDAHEALGKGIA